MAMADAEEGVIWTEEKSKMMAVGLGGRTDALELLFIMPLEERFSFLITPGMIKLLDSRVSFAGVESFETSNPEVEVALPQIFKDGDLTRALLPLQCDTAIACFAEITMRACKVDPLLISREFPLGRLSGRQAFSKAGSEPDLLGPCEPYRSFEPTDDHVWADCLVNHSADVLRYCFGSDAESTHVAAADTTSAQRISQYEELCFLMSHGKSFTLSISFPSMPARQTTRGEKPFPRFGISTTATLLVHRFMDMGHRSINQYSPPRLVVASMAIRMCGDRFTMQVNEEALLTLLVMLKENHARRRQQLLKKAWGWFLKSNIMVLRQSGQHATNRRDSSSYFSEGDTILVKLNMPEHRYRSFISNSLITPSLLRVPMVLTPGALMSRYKHSLPTTDTLGVEISTDCDAQKEAEGIVARLSTATSKGDAQAFTGLFLNYGETLSATRSEIWTLDDFECTGVWRDKLLFTWDFHTFNFREAISKAATDLLPQTNARNFDFLEPATSVPRPYPDFSPLQFVVSFETEIVLASAVINAVLTQDGWRIYTMHTVAESLKQFPEQAAPDAHMTGITSWESHRAEAINRVDPEVLIIGGGQNLPAG
ncbi:uncharacterized protein P174DRAFT_426227 [Aspergillus novofumigatus IBT 16806]|uniref:Uncharacterized protein n=1 Tax=Aspergillus novofumigatus (strain IBT 16806) TaxID=1392255 RepID=A0A2I1CJR9_ASPN1|nr:uncharacterized protein P174DRAFT_426227 [Aspergillus novofumigatus IBT 16806]PKX97865.1 hypothetical protein P174DRAFT_426227 [Aspergillus novofumigatus IBT 16806]